MHQLCRLYIKTGKHSWRLSMRPFQIRVKKQSNIYCATFIKHTTRWTDEEEAKAELKVEVDKNTKMLPALQTTTDYRHETRPRDHASLKAVVDDEYRTMDGHLRDAAEEQSTQMLTDFFELVLKG